MNKKFKKASLAVGMALAVTVSMALPSKSAFATIIVPGGSPGYLSTPTISTTPIDSTSFISTVQPVSGPSSSYYVTPTSLFGNTFVTPGPGIDTVTATTTSPNDLYYSTSGLNLSLVNSITSNYTLLGASGSPTITGQVVSNVFKIGAGSTMPGALTGELVFTYQFSVSTITPSYASGPNQLSLAYLDNPAGTGMWTLGDGLITATSGTNNYTQISGGATPTCLGGSACSYANISQVTGNETLNTSNGGINTAQYTATTTIGVGQMTPEFFVASNAYAYSQGTFSVQGNGGSGTAPVFVPDLPEPGTIVLFGTALGLVAFMYLRNRKAQIVV